MRRLLLLPKHWLAIPLTAFLIALPTGGALAGGDNHRGADRPDQSRLAGTVARHPMAIDPMSYHYGHTLARLSGAQLETTFMGGMIPHHQAAIAMAQLELRRGTSPQIKGMARTIISSQTREIKQMTAWLKNWYRLTPQQAIGRAPALARTQIQQMDMMMRDHMIAPLQATPTGPRFDPKFVSMMIPHHQMAILETPPIQDQGAHPNLVRAANNIALSQEQEVIQMLQWLQAHSG